MDPVHADKRSARLVPLRSLEPVPAIEQRIRNRRVNAAVRWWVSAVNDAGRKRLALSAESVEAKALWQRYRAVARHLWKLGRRME